MRGEGLGEGGRSHGESGQKVIEARLVFFDFFGLFCVHFQIIISAHARSFLRPTVETSRSTHRHYR